MTTSEPPRAMRLFFAISPSDELRARIDDLCRPLRRRAKDAKWVSPSLVHLTLAFLGEVAEGRLEAIVDAARTVAVRERKFEVSVAGGGAFGRPAAPRILWLGLADDTERLEQLHGRLVGALEPLGLTSEDRVFSPHLTLARARSSGDPALASCGRMLAAARLGSMAVEALDLFESHLSPAGPRYELRVRIPLIGRRAR